MGIIKAFTGSVGGVMADQWLEMFYCNSIPQGVLAVVGTKQVSERSSNTKGNPNIISDGSIIVVNEGQCAIVLESGKVIDFHDTPGENIFHSNRSPSLFSGRGLKGLGSSVMERVGYGGDSFVHQTVIYLSLREQTGIPFSLTCPVHVKDKGSRLYMDATLRMEGVFSLRITDPLTFYRVVCGNAAGTVYLSMVRHQLQAEFNTAAMEAIGRLSEQALAPSEIPSKSDEISRYITECMTEQWVALRGFSVVSTAISSLSVSHRDLGTFQMAERAKMLSDPETAAATLTGAQADAMKAAGENGNAAPAFAAVNMADTSVKNEQPPLWYCSCGRFCSTRFCPECGAKRPD